MQIQLRSERHGTSHTETLAAALSAADANRGIWNISFSLLTGERMRLIRDVISGQWCVDVEATLSSVPSTDCRITLHHPSTLTPDSVEAYSDALRQLVMIYMKYAELTRERAQVKHDGDIHDLKAVVIDHDIREREERFRNNRLFRFA